MWMLYALLSRLESGPILRIFLIIHTPMVSAGARAKPGSGGRAPSGGPGGRAPGGGKDGEAPLKPTRFLCLKH